MQNGLRFMHTTTEGSFLNNSQPKRYVITFVVSAMLLYLLLLIPYKIAIKHYKEQPINIILSKSVVVEKKQVKKATTKTTISTQKKPVVQNKPINKPIKKPEQPVLVKKTFVQDVRATKPKEQQAIKVTKQPQLPTTAELLNSIKTRKNVQLSQDFQAKTGHEDDFVFKSVEQAQMFKEFKLINEEVDKPQYEMNFYSEGIEGSVERFMDKITYKKRFTTRYGTKIDCVSVAIVLTACGWK